MVSHYLGPNWVITTLYVCLLSNCGCIIVYLEVVSNFSVAMFGEVYQFTENSYLNKEYFKLFQMLIFLLFLEVPLCLVEKIRPLHFISLIGTFLLLYVVIVKFCINL